MFHAMVLFSLFVLYGGNNFSFDIVVNHKQIASGAPVVFMPLYKVVNQKKVKNVKKVAHKPKPKKKPEKKVTLAKQQKDNKPKKIAENKKNKKVSKKETKKTKAGKKNVVASKKDVPKKNIKQVSKEKKVVKQKEHPIYVGQFQMTALTMQEQVQKEVTKYWKPPEGLPKDLACTLKILVDWYGKVRKTTIEKSSGVLMYDISARTAVATLAVPKVAYGKGFSITFKQ